MSRKTLATVAALVVLTLRTAGAAAEPADRPIHIGTSSTVETDGGSTLRLPPGYFLTEPLYSKLDTELIRLQDAETRLTAENETLRKKTESWSPGWRTLAASFVAGIAVTAYALR